MNAAIDIGNTKAKLGFFKENELVAYKAFNELKELADEIKKSEVSKVIISSVREDDESIKKILDLREDPFFLNYKTPVPFVNNYQSPTLGLDRIAIVAGAQTLFPDQHTLAIDLGTCITYDFLEAGIQYHGGAISPGMHMRFKALHNFTARLPLINPAQQVDVIGNSTENSIQSGVVHGVSGEIRAFINTYKEKYNPLNVIITGGDAKYFESKIKATIFAIPELVLVGLNAILRHNASI
ncbi:type III pantothenate kinase [Marivirga lumbricoides]